ncbi:MAG: nitrogen fixation protein NifU [Parcubacteria group bacterium Gr01-1014_29]|nr:MAG: nitrogen fixation protein NifU [Parcubacteria group bacterium Gr01-1014_29]
MDDLYKEHILNHYRNPRNKYALVGADLVGNETNTLCGDEITMYAHIDAGGIITAMSFVGEGCAISQAAASLFTDFAKGKRADEIRNVTQQDMEQLLGIPVSIIRARCAVLAVQAFRNGFNKNLC